MGVSDLVRQGVEWQSALYFQSASPVLGGCVHLAINDAMRCVQRLAFGNEVLLAAAVCRVLARFRSSNAWGL